MDPSSNTPQSSRSKICQPNPGYNAFHMDTPPPIYIPNPVFVPPMYNPFGMGYNTSPQGFPNLPSQVTYNEFRCQTQSPLSTYEFEHNDICPDPHTIPETQEGLDSIP